MAPHPIIKFFSFALLLSAIFLATAVAYIPALSGPFVLDDKVHVPKLAGSDGQTDTRQEVHALAFSGQRFPARQLSYLSLLIDDNRWPTSPKAFKRTNLLLHLLNAVLVLVVVRQLLQLTDDSASRNGLSTQQEYAALIAMALWVLHPIHISASMMVIQRMTLLAAFFSLAALIAYIRGRRLLLLGRLTGYLWLAVAFPLAIALGILCKETAVVTVLYVLALESTILSKSSLPRPKGWGPYAALYLAGPTIAVVVYYWTHLASMNEFYAIRDFNMGERLLSQFRVLADYLRNIFAPTIGATGPYHDDYIPSRSLFSPPSTLPAIGLAVGALAVAILYRKRSPLLALPILWFYGGHALESTALPLELYFEHRNYLPMLGIVIAFAIWAGSFKQTSSAASRYQIPLVGGAAIAITFASITFLTAKVWGDPVRSALIWSHEHPASARAQLDAIVFYAGSSDTAKLREALEEAISHHGDTVGLDLTRWALQRCQDLSAPALGADWDALKAKIPSAKFDYLALGTLQWIAKNREARNCRISDSDVLELVDAFLKNDIFSNFKVSRARMFQVKLEVYRRQGDLDKTIAAMDGLYDTMPNYITRLHQAEALLSAGLLDDAENFLRLAEQSPRRFLGQNLLKSEDISRVRRLIDMAKSSASRDHDGQQTYD